VRVLVTGSRNWTDANAITDQLAAYADKAFKTEVACNLIIVHGANPGGADHIAAEWASERQRANILGKRANWIWAEPHPADWAKHGKAAGPIRNQEMVDAGADICLAFPLGESRGTRDCMRRAESAGIPVIAHEHAGGLVGGFA
jgi:hypothetical protein